MRSRAYLFMLLLCGWEQAHAATPTAQELAAMMRVAQYSNGFAARMSVLVTHPNGAHEPPFKVAVVGQASAQQQRLLLRGIEPAALRVQRYVAERKFAGKTLTIRARAAQPSGNFALDEPLFNSGLVLGDMFSPWWDWSQQTLLGTDKVKGHACLKVRSVNDDVHAPIQTVESCVDTQAQLSLRTRWYDAQQVLQRSAVVGATLRKAEGSGQLAKQVSLRDATGQITDINIYAGDEQYQITPQTFELLEMSEGAR